MIKNRTLIAILMFSLLPLINYAQNSDQLEEFETISFYDGDTKKKESFDRVPQENQLDSVFLVIEDKLVPIMKTENIEITKAALFKYMDSGFKVMIGKEMVNIPISAKSVELVIQENGSINLDGQGPVRAIQVTKWIAPGVGVNLSNINMDIRYNGVQKLKFSFQIVEEE